MEKVVLFDFFGVIAMEPMFATNVIYEHIKDEVDYNLFKKKYISFALGVIGEDEFWRGVSSSKKDMISTLIRDMPLNESVLNLIVNLADSNPNLQIMIASESPRQWIDTVLAANQLNLAFSGHYVSSDMGTTKPFDKYFKHIKDELLSSERRVFLLDDSAENVEAAKRYGIESYKYPEDFLKFKEKINSNE